MTVECSRTTVALIVRVTGWVDGETAPELQEVFRQRIAPTDKNMILDLAQVEYVSSAGLGSVLFAGKTIDRNGGQLRICGLAGRLLRIFSNSGLDTLFPIFVDQQAAIADCRLEIH